MKKKFAFYFPHIIRRYSAGKLHIPFGKLFWIFFITVTISNIFSDYLIPPSKERQLQMQIMRKPALGMLHEELGQFYLAFNKTASYKEYLLAQEYFLQSQSNKSNVLGIQTQPITTWKNLEVAKDLLLDDINYWKNVLKNYPDYQYAILQISALYAELGNKEQAFKYINEFLKSTPVDNTAHSLLQKLKD